ncbi:MAG: sulfatase-like hydrolase/transferase [Thermomicrobiales bacterium]
MNSMPAGEERGIGAETRPNIVVILSDDQGPWALGCAGNSEIRTPNLDRLAAEGTRFDRFFCASPVCSPARATLLTGQIPSQHGVHDWIDGGNMQTATLDPIKYLAGKTSYTQVLAANGYTCGLSGKWHLGDSIVPQHGFSHWYVHQRGGGPYYNAPMIRNGELIDQPGYLTDCITDDALEFIDEQQKRDDPFYLSVHYTAPHSPWVDSHPQEIVDSYDACPFDSIPRDPMHPWALPGWVPTPESTEWREDLKGYFAAVTAMDANVGRILDKLDALGLRENTLIWFLGDNGFNCGHHGLWGKGNASFPFNMYDESVLVPAIVCHPGRIPSGIVRSEMVSGYDFALTLLEYAGFRHPDANVLPGQSFRYLLDPDARIDTNPRDHVVIYDEYGPVRMIRTDAWKYVHRYPYGPHELYDLVSDPGERNNRIEDAAYLAVVERLRNRLERWYLDYADPAVDGVREPVTGTGQIERSGPANGGRLAFLQGQRLDKEAEQRSLPRTPDPGTST